MYLLYSRPTYKMWVGRGVPGPFGPLPGYAIGSVFFVRRIWKISVWNIVLKTVKMSVSDDHVDKIMNIECDEDDIFILCPIFFQ